MAELYGKIHSLQSLGAVDGPGLRYVVFMQGCPLRCVYCHNPDTWDRGGGQTMSVSEIFEKVLRCKSYIKNGGLTVSGGEPLIQAEFVAELFGLARKNGIHTALDTSCVRADDAAVKLLDKTDLVLADLKFLTAEEYKNNCGADFNTVKAFLDICREMKKPLWIRHVVVPGLTDGEEHIRELFSTVASYPNVEKTELLPFEKLCIEKYRALGIEFPLGAVPAMDISRLKELERIGMKVLTERWGRA